MLFHDSGHQVTVPAPPSIPSFLVLQASVAQTLILCEQGERGGEPGEEREEEPLTAVCPPPELQVWGFDN